MRIFFRVGEGVMHAVHDRVRARTHVRGALRNVSENKKEPFPEFIHRECAMRGIPVIEKTLRKERQVPMHDKKDDDDVHFIYALIFFCPQFTSIRLLQQVIIEVKLFDLLQLCLQPVEMFLFICKDGFQ